VQDDRDDQGRVTDANTIWDYSPAFGGADIDDEEEEDAPLEPTCGASLHSGGPWGTGSIAVGTAGVHDGRDAHRITTHEVPLTEAGLAELVGLLDTSKRRHGRWPPSRTSLVSRAGRAGNCCRPAGARSEQQAKTYTVVLRTSAFRAHAAGPDGVRGSRGIGGGPGGL
jgi:hypothetical protein